MKDLIDERNFREKCASSIVKGYNVRYVMPGEQKVETEEVEEAAAVQEAGNPKGVLDDEGRWANIPSAGYGKKKDNDPVTEEQIRRILGQQSEGTMELLAGLGEEPPAMP